MRVIRSGGFVRTVLLCDAHSTDLGHWTWEPASNDSPCRARLFQDVPEQVNVGSVSSARGLFMSASRRVGQASQSR